MVVFSFLIVGVIYCTFACTKSDDKSKLMKKIKRNPATVYSLAALSFITNVYIIFLAVTAIIYWQYHGESELRDLFHKIEIERTLGPLVFALIVDLLCFIAWVTIFVIFME